MAIPDDLTPRAAPGLLRELSPDVRAALLLDAAGAVVADSEDEGDAEELAALVRDLVAAADATGPGPPPEQVEVQVEGGTVYAARDSHHVLAAVTRRAALSSLMLYDMRAVLSALSR